MTTSLRVSQPKSETILLCKFGLISEGLVKEIWTSYDPSLRPTRQASLKVTSRREIGQLQTRLKPFHVLDTWTRLEADSDLISSKL